MACPVLTMGRALFDTVLSRYVVGAQRCGRQSTSLTNAHRPNSWSAQYESGGQFFPFVADRIMVCAAVMVAFTGECLPYYNTTWASAAVGI
jgi:hypothetical protein